MDVRKRRSPAVPLGVCRSSATARSPFPLADCERLPGKLIRRRPAQITVRHVIAELVRAQHRSFGADAGSALADRGPSMSGRPERPEAASPQTPLGAAFTLPTGWRRTGCPPGERIPSSVRADRPTASSRRGRSAGRDPRQRALHVEVDTAGHRRQVTHRRQPYMQAVSAPQQHRFVLAQRSSRHGGFLRADRKAEKLGIERARVAGSRQLMTTASSRGTGSSFGQGRRGSDPRGHRHLGGRQQSPCRCRRHRSRWTSTDHRSPPERRGWLRPRASRWPGHKNSTPLPRNR